MSKDKIAPTPFQLSNYAITVRVVGAYYHYPELKEGNKCFFGITLGSLISIPLSMWLFPNTLPIVSIIASCIATILTTALFLRRFFQSAIIPIRPVQMPEGMQALFSSEGISLKYKDVTAAGIFRENGTLRIHDNHDNSYDFCGDASQEALKDLIDVLHSQKITLFRKIDKRIVVTVTLDDKNCKAFRDKFAEQIVSGRN